MKGYVNYAQFYKHAIDEKSPRAFPSQPQNPC